MPAPALARARDEGLTRFIGVTGHGLRIASMHLRSLERFDFDSVLLPYNFVLMGQDDIYIACDFHLHRGEKDCIEGFLFDAQLIRSR